MECTLQEKEAQRGAEDALPGFLVIAAGGAGKASTLSAVRQHQAAEAPFVMHTLAIDTDPEGLGTFDSAINIALSREAVSAMKSDPQRYGPACQAVVRHHPHLLESETLGRGARTHRPLTQVAWELSEARILEGLRAAVHAILKRGPFARIQPVVLASMGGGTGSAALILLLNDFLNPQRKSHLTLGLPPDLVAIPAAFVIDAYSHALQQRSGATRDWILSNLYASRFELALCEVRGTRYQYIFHLGLGNDAGAVFPSIEEVCEANGLLAWEWMANFAHFKSRAVDSLHFAMTSAHFRGGNTPESLIPKDEWPPYASREGLDAGPGA